MTRAMQLAATAVTVVLLAGCGLKGDLETPPPLWGDSDRDVVERNLPGRGEQDNRIVFTRDDIDLFQDEDEEEDPFAEENGDGPSEENVEGVGDAGGAVE